MKANIAGCENIAGCDIPDSMPGSGKILPEFLFSLIWAVRSREKYCLKSRFPDLGSTQQEKYCLKSRFPDLGSTQQGKILHGIMFSRFRQFIVFAP